MFISPESGFGYPGLTMLESQHETKEKPACSSIGPSRRPGRRQIKVASQAGSSAHQRREGRPSAAKTPGRKVSERLWLRGTTWWIAYQKDGQRIRESTKTSNQAEAKKYLDNVIAEVAKNGYRGNRNEPTFEDLWELLVEDYEANGKNLKALRVRYVHLEPYLRGLRAKDIDSIKMMDYRRMRRDQGASFASINREYAALQRAFRLAEENNLIWYHQTFSKVRENNVRGNWLTLEQFEALLAELPDYFKGVARAGYITGWRVNELCARQWKDVDFAQRTLRIEPGLTKNREGRMFTLEHVGLLEVLEKQRAWVNEIEQRIGLAVPWVFCHRNGTPIRDYYGMWRSACKRAGLEGTWFHDFRRVAARNLDKRVRRSVAMAMLGHKTEAMFRRYAIVIEHDIHEAGRALQDLHLEQKDDARKEQEARQANGGKVLPLRRAGNE